MTQLPQIVFGPLGHPRGVTEAHQGVAGQIVRRGGQLVIDPAQGQVRGAGPGVVLGEEDLPGGQEGAGLPLGGAPLGHRVKQAHGVDLIPPKFHPHRQVQAGGEDVQNAPPQANCPVPSTWSHRVYPARTRKSVSPSG